MRLVGDIEANGLYNEASRIHCIVLKDIDTKEVHRFPPHLIEAGLRMMMDAELLVFHNGICYDFPTITKVYPWFQVDWDRVIDTLNLSRLLWPNLSDLDSKRGRKVREALAEARRIGSHSLEGWGLRFGYPKVEHDDWENYSPAMLVRCEGDVEITDRLWTLIQEEGVDPRASELEHKVQVIIARQERYGFPFDEAKANTLTAKLIARKAALEAELQDTFKPFYLPDGKPVAPKKTMLRKGVIYTEGQPYQKIKLTIFNPGSTHHIAGRLKALYGWKPTEFTPSGLPKVDETVLSKLPWPEAKLLAEYFLVQKRLALVSEGERSFTSALRNGKCYGELITNGAVTGRGTHRIIANVPRVSSPYGKEMRELFTCSPGRVQVGIDVSGLELRMLAHFLARFDGGSYGRIVCEGDVHWANVQALELTEEERCTDEGKTKVYKLHAVYRDGTKTFIYAFLYGGGSEKIGSIILKIMLAAKQAGLDWEPIAKKFFKGKANPGTRDLIACGKRLKDTFVERVPGLKTLLDNLKVAVSRGYLIGLDGRKVILRSDHSALNFLLQSSGSLICKRWMVELDEAIRERGWDDKVQQLIWYHDELQFDCDKDIAEEFGKLAVECIKRAAQYFSIRVPLTGEFKIGSNWKECH